EIAERCAHLGVGVGENVEIESERVSHGRDHARPRLAPPHQAEATGKALPRSVLHGRLDPKPFDRPSFQGAAKISARAKVKAQVAPIAAGGSLSPSHGGAPDLASASDCQWD